MNFMNLCKNNKKKGRGGACDVTVIVVKRELGYPSLNPDENVWISPS